MSLRPNEKTNARRNRYKAGVDKDEGRRKREDNLVEMRKNKREESLTKKRRHGLDDPQDLAPKPTASVHKTLLNLEAMIAWIESDDPKLQLESTAEFRMVLSADDAPIDEVIKSGVVPRFVEFLKRNDFPRLQFEAAWILTNIASGTSEHTKVVIDLGAIPIFIQLLASPDDDVREQVIWALGNVAGESTHFRDYVLNCGALMAMMPLLAQLNDHSKLSMLRNTAWTLSNFCRGNPQPAYEQVEPALPALERLILSNDEEVLTDTCWALTDLSDIREVIQSLINAGVVPRLVELLMHRSLRVHTPVIRIIGNIVAGNAEQTQYVIDCGALPILGNMLTLNYKRFIKNDACWTISNITARGKEQIQSVIDANLIPTLVSLAQTAEFDVKKEALWAISNAITSGSHDQIKYLLVAQSCIKPLCDNLVCPDLDIISVCLDGLEHILKVGEVEKGTGGDMNYCQMIEDAEGLEKIENLQSNDNTEIYEKAVKILETYWVEEDDLETQEHPAGDDGSHMDFQFGSSSTL